MKKRVSKSSHIKAVVFDVGGVLQLGGAQRLNPKMTHTSGVHQRVANKLKITLDQYFDSIDTIYAKSIEGQVSESVLMGVLSCNLNYPKEKLEKLFISTYRKIYKKNNYLFSVAKKIKKQGIKISILSDQWHVSKKALMPKKDYSIFSPKIVSCDVHTRKPSQKIFKILLEKLNLKPEEILFIDNKEWNIIAANKMGFATILFTDNKKIKQQLSYFGIKIK